MLRDILELRTMVCTHLVRLAARRARKWDQRRIQAIIDQMVQATDDPEALIRLDFDMYWEFARAGSSIVGQLLLNTFRSTLEQNTEMFAAMAVDARLAVVSQRALAEAVARGNPEEASRVAEEQLRRGTQKALSAFGLEPIDGRHDV